MSLVDFKAVCKLRLLC